MKKLRALRAQRAEGGFTLVELMVAVAITGIVIAPLAAGMFVVLRTMDQTTNRRASSADAQQLSLYLPPDVQSADNAKTTGITCGTLTSPALQLWSTVYDTNFSVGYGVRQAADGSWQLVRQTCAGGATKTIARNLASSTAVLVTRTPSSTSLPLQSVSVRLTEKGTPTDPTQHQFTVLATRRTSP